MNFYRSVIRPLLFRLNAEFAHTLAVESCRFGGGIPGIPCLIEHGFPAPSARLRTSVACQDFPSPIGLAAGWDKSGKALRILERLGFGFIEIGSVSAVPSVGNPRPRLFRLPQDEAIVVNYGLPNDGADVVANRLAIDAAVRRVPVGVNIVKTNRGPGSSPATADEIFTDFESSAKALHDHADYLMLNLSCPNVDSGNNSSCGDFFREPGNIRRLLERIATINPCCPVFLKTAPTTDDALLDQMILQTEPFNFVKGFSINLPAGKPESLSLRTSRSVWTAMPGAVSGRPCRPWLDECLRKLYRRLPPKRFALLASGGVFTADDAWVKFQFGASLVQIYTGLIYEGPGLIRRIHEGLERLLDQHGIRQVSDIVGSAV